MAEEINLKINLKSVLKGVIIIAMLLAVFFAGRWSAGDTPTGMVTTEEVEVALEEPLPVIAPSEVEPDLAPEVEVDAQPEVIIEEKIITSYSKVALAIESIHKDWKGTWGKITQLQYTIKNNEEGTVKPAYFIMTVEGYDDIAKTINIPLIIKAGQSYTGNVNIPQGFAYNAVTAGNLANVRVTLVMFDASDKSMASFVKEYDLNG
jgi:hypothetical protein